MGSVSDSRIAGLIYYSWEDVGNFFHRQGRLITKMRKSRHDLYGQALVMTHYFANNPERGKNLKKYIEKINSGVHPEMAFSSSFPISMDDLNREIKDYFRRGKYPYRKVELKSPLAADSIIISKLSMDELADVIGRYITRRGEVTDDEILFYSAQLENGTISAGGLSVLAHSAIMRDKLEGSEEVFRIL